jgi:hypothetical protein
MTVNYKKNIMLFIIDVLFIFLAIYNITKSESEMVFYAAFFYFFIIIFIYLSFKKEAEIPGNVFGWEKVLYILGITLFIFKLSAIKKIFSTTESIENYDDWILIINTFFLGIGALVLFLRIKEILQNAKHFLK